MRGARFGTAIDTNEIVGIIPLTQNQHTIISPFDIGKTEVTQWYAQKDKVKHTIRYYAQNRRLFGKFQQLHRYLIDVPEDLVVDHINGNSLDNRKSNLRIVTSRKNAQNRHDPKTSKYPGVHWDISKQKWESGINFKNKKIHLGVFDTEEEAYECYKYTVSQLDNPNIDFTKFHRKSTSNYKGVWWDKSRKKWVSQITINGCRKFIGRFDREIDAHKAYLTFEKCQEATA